MPKPKAQSNKEQKEKLKEKGSKQVNILLSKEEFDKLNSFMALHKINSYREFVNFATDYKLVQINPVIEIPLTSKPSAGGDTFIKNGKKYEILSQIVYGSMNENVETGELFPF